MARVLTLFHSRHLARLMHCDPSQPLSKMAIHSRKPLSHRGPHIIFTMSTTFETLEFPPSPSSTLGGGIHEAPSSTLWIPGTLVYTSPHMVGPSHPQ